MKILILGATGATGTLATDAVIASGNEVVAVTRTVGKLASRNGLKVVQGDARDADTLARAAEGVDAIISTLRVGSTRKPNDLIRDTTRAVVTAARRTGITKVVVQSAFGVGSSYSKGSLLLRLGYRLAPAVFIDKAAGEKVLMDSPIRWTIAYPGLLTSGPVSGKLTVTDLADVTRLPGLPRISRADVAEFLLAATTDDRWSRRIAVLTVRR
jgi:uncharacterized protein YbjT (DUF2867 family)